MSAISCPLSGVCDAVGSYTDGAGHQAGLLVVVNYARLVFAPSSIPAPADAGPDPAVSFSAIRCDPLPSPPLTGPWLACDATGSYQTSSGATRAFVSTYDGTTWTVAPAPLPVDAAPTGDSLTSLSCVQSGGCTAAGSYGTNDGHSRALLETLASGIWSAGTAPLPASASAAAQLVNLGSLACPASGACTAVGTYTDQGLTRGVLFDQSGSSWSASVAPLPSDAAPGGPVRLSQVACPAAGSCTAVGTYPQVGATTAGFIIHLTGGVWTPSTAGRWPGDGPSSSYGLSTISCPAVTWCTAGGGYVNGPGLAEQIEYGATADSLSLTVPASPWTAATPETLSASVQPVPAGGSVAFYNDTLQVCSAPVDPTTGLATCSYTPAVHTDPGAPLQLYASYGGDATAAPVGAAGPVAQSVALAPTALTITTTINPVAAGGAVSYGATLSPFPLAPSRDPTVGFTDNGVAIPGCTALDVGAGGTVPCGVTAPSTGGSHVISAAYAGDATYAPASGSLAQTVLPPPVYCPVGTTHHAAGSPWAVAAMTADVAGTSCAGYWVATRSGGVTAIGEAPWLGDVSSIALNAPVVAIASTPDHRGYYLLGADGGVFAFGDAVFYGSTGGLHLNKPVVAMAVTPSGRGYWLTASDGGVFGFGDATFHGSTGGLRLNQPIVGMTADPQTGGYWLVAADGGMFDFGAPFFGSTGNLRLNQPVVGMAASPDGGGYILVARDGGVFGFGDSPFYGSLPALGVANPDVTTVAESSDGGGYYLINSLGTIWAFGDAPALGSA